MKCWLLSLMLPLWLSAETLPLIPAPRDWQPLEGFFPISSALSVEADPAVQAEAELFCHDLKQACGLVLMSQSPTTSKREQVLRFSLAAANDWPAAAYKIILSPQSVEIQGKDAAGVFYGSRTLLQLFPPIGDSRWQRPSDLRLPCGQLFDAPRFVWRGLMLDVARHFFSVDEIKRLLDSMAFYKLNRFHWHLTDDQGWRMEIKGYPRLTELGAWRDSTPPYGDRTGSDGKRYGGFYTQEQIRDVVAYAAQRHISVIPEIELPGHAAAAISAYPELGNVDVPDYAPKVMTKWGVHPYTFAPTDATVHFFETVFDEVCSLFPSRYIHMGGDEAPKTQWQQSAQARHFMQREGLRSEEELQAWFVRRIEKIVSAHGRRLIGWDEIQEGGLVAGATMMVWRDEKWARHALARGNSVIMAPSSHLYFDHYQVPAELELARGPEFEAIGGFLPLERVYAYDPGACVEDESQRSGILGVQAQLWTEYIKDFRKLDHMAFPRVAALSEVAWSQVESKNFADFQQRLERVRRHEFSSLGSDSRK